MIDVDIIYNILQYGAVQDTIECVESIENKSTDHSFHIVIVDNCSPDNSADIIEKKYNGRKDITVIRNNKNLGFAKGNNLGISFATKNFNYRYIISLNNDIKILEVGLFEILESEFDRSEFALLGPMILTADGKYISNPVRKEPLTKSQILKRIKREKNLLRLHTFDYFGILDFLRRLRVFLLKKERVVNAESHFIRQQNVQLHGSFLVFSKKFFEVFEGFDESTYMYMEEYFLYKHLLENQLTTVYLPKIKIYHKEDASTDQVLTSNRKKELFIRKHSFDSALKLYDLYERYEMKGENDEK